MAFATLADDAAFDALMRADLVRAAAFVFIDWPDTPIYASTHVRSVTAAGKTWTGVGAAGLVEPDTAQQNGAAQRWTVGLKGVPASPVMLATQVSAVGVDVEIYIGAFDAGWQSPVLKLMFAGYAEGRRTRPHATPEGFVVDVSMEVSDGVNPKRAVQFHWADGVGAAGDTAQRLLYTVARSTPWPGWPDQAGCGRPDRPHRGNPERPGNGARERSRSAQGAGADRHRDGGDARCQGRDEARTIVSLAYAAVIVAVALVILAGAALWWRRGVRQAGRDRQKLRQQEASNETQREMLDAATRRPRDRDDLARRLRDGTF